MVDERRKEILHNKWNLKIYLIYFFRGFRGIVFSRKKRIGAVLFIVSLCAITSAILFKKPTYVSVFVNLNRITESLRVIIVVVAAVFVLLLIILRKQARENANIALKRTKRASKVATKRLKSAAKFMKANDKPHFYEETMKALWGYLGDKLSIAQSELTKDNVSEKLSARGVEDETIKEFLATLQDCEFARFSSVADESLSMNNIYNRASDLIGKLEDKL